MALRLILALALFTPHISAAEVLVVDSSEKETLAVIKSMPASFGRPLPEDGVHGRAILAHPKDGCSQIDPPPALDNATTDELLTEVPLQPPAGNFVFFSSFRSPNFRSTFLTDDDEGVGKKLPWIALISRYGGCAFEDKVRNAQAANYSAVIVYNVGSDKVIPMGGDDTSLIPSVFIGESDAHLIAKMFVYTVNPHVHIVITDDEPFDINSYLLPFAIVVGICFLIMLGIVIFKCVQDHRRNRRHRLPKSALKKLPIHKFKNGDPFETCCICLDDFEEGDKLRVLPCDHGYHAKCIDPWLLKNKRICPQCRKKVFASNERGAGLITGSGGSDSEEETTNERAPLLRPQPQRSTSSYGGTSPSTSGFLAAGDGASTSSGASTTHRGETLSTSPASRLPSRRRPFLLASRRDPQHQQRDGGRRRHSGGGSGRTLPPFDNTAEDSSSSSSEASTSSSDDEGNAAEDNRNETTHRVMVVGSDSRRNISAEVHLPPPVNEDAEDRVQVGDDAPRPHEVVVVIQPEQHQSEIVTSQSPTGATNTTTETV